MTSLQGKKVVVIGGSSGIGYSVAKASLISLADHIIIASSSQSRVDTAVLKLLTEPAIQQLTDPSNRLSGYPLDLTDSNAIIDFFQKIGEIDHLVITSGVVTAMVNFKEVDLNKYRG